MKHMMILGLMLGSMTANAENFDIGSAVNQNTPLSSVTLLGWAADGQGLLVFSETSWKKTHEDVQTKGSALIFDTGTGKLVHDIKNACQCEVPLGRGTAGGGCAPNPSLESVVRTFVEPVKTDVPPSMLSLVGGVLTIRDGATQLPLGDFSELTAGKPKRCKISDLRGEMSSMKGSKTRAVVLWSNAKKCRLKKSPYGAHRVQLLFIPEPIGKAPKVVAPQ